MAKKKHVGVKELSELLQCPTCFESCDDPRSLPCLHWVCKTCLTELIRQTSNGRNVLCPNCRVSARIPANGASGFPVAFWVNTLRELTVSERGPDGSEDIWCTAHKRECEMFCTDCNQLICGKCCAQEHKSHSKVHAEEIVGQHRENIQQSLEERRGVLTQFETSFKKLKWAKNVCRFDCKVAKTAISKQADDVIWRIKNMVLEKHQIFESETSRYVSDIESSEERMTGEFQKLKDVVEQNESSVKCENAAVVVHTSVNKLPEQSQIMEGAIACPGVTRMKIQVHPPDVDPIRISSGALLGKHEFVRSVQSTVATTQFTASLEVAEGGASIASAEDVDALFPVDALTKLNQMINRSQWMISVLPKGELEVLLNASLSLRKQGLDLYNENCLKFYKEGLRVSFIKMYNCSAVCGWEHEIHKCILNHTMKLVELCVIKLDQYCLPLLSLLAVIFDQQSTFHLHNKTYLSQTVPAESTLADDELFARPRTTAANYGWLVDLLNKFGELKGFQLLHDHLTSEFTPPMDVIVALIQPFGLCLDLLTPHTINTYFLPIVKKSKDVSTIGTYFHCMMSRTHYEGPYKH